MAEQKEEPSSEPTEEQHTTDDDALARRKQLNAFVSKDSIDYLVRRRFKRLEYGERMAAAASLNSFDVAEGIRDADKPLKAYRDELEAKTPAEIQALVSEAKAAEQKLIALKAEQEEQERFFNQPSAIADFAHWSKCPHWSLEEAIALSFGKAPGLVTWRTLQPHVGCSPFVYDYARRRDLALRAVPWKHLSDPVLPRTFLAWAKKNEFEVPPELVARVEARGIPVEDWKGLYDKAVQERDAARVRVAELESQSTKEVSARSETGYLNTIGALLALLLAEKVNGKPGFPSQAAVISAIQTEYPQKFGLSKRELEAKFAEAKRSLKTA